MHTLFCSGGRVYNLPAITVETPGFTLVGTSKAGTQPTALQWSNITPPGGLIVQAVCQADADQGIELVVETEAGDASVFITLGMGPILILCARRVNKYVAMLAEGDAVAATTVNDVAYKANT